MKDIAWFPGHMAKTRRMIAESLKLVDCVIELVDARAPHSSRNPEIESIIGKKPHVLVLNKADLANPAVNEKWLSHYREKGLFAVGFNSLANQSLEGVKAAIRESLSDLIGRRKERGILGGSIKLIVVGVPNVGKSSFINRFAGRAGAKTGDRPGVTKGKQWIRQQSGFELLDVPGVLWPKFDDPKVGLYLAFIGSIKDEILDTVELSVRLLEHIKTDYWESLEKQYGISDAQSHGGEELLNLVARRRGFLISGGELDIERAAITVLTEFRSGRLGRISLESPPLTEGE